MVKRVPKIVLMSVLLALCYGGGVRLYAETVYATGPYIQTVSTVIEGDLVVTDGGIYMDGVGTVNLTVNGDVKVTGSVIVTEGTLTVNGDLIVTNTREVDADAVVSVGHNIIVTGAIITRSDHDNAYVEAIGAEGFDSSIEAESITTRGYGEAYVKVSGAIAGQNLVGLIVVGEIDTRSEDADAYVYVVNDSIDAGSIVTCAKGDAYVEAESIRTTGEINTYSEEGDAYVRVLSLVPFSITKDNGYYGGGVGNPGTLYAGSITTNGLNDSTVIADEHIEVKGILSTTSRNGVAYVQTNGIIAVTIICGAIITDGFGDAYVQSASRIEVRGDINTRSQTGQAYVWAQGGDDLGGSLLSTNVTTSGMSHAYVRAREQIDVRRDIWTWSLTGSGDVQSGYSNGERSARQSNGVYTNDVMAYRITTWANWFAGILSYGGSILTRGPIYTRSIAGDAMIVAYGEGDAAIKAESIFTHGLKDGVILIDAEEGELIVKDLLRTRSDTADAYIDIPGDIKARSIETNGASSGFLIAYNGSIDVVGDIRTRAVAGPSYVSAQDNNVRARSIKTISENGGEDWVAAAPGTAHFQWFPHMVDAAITFSNCEFYLDTDHTWTTMLTLEGTCTFNGNDHKLEFGPGGGILVASGASLLLKNIVLDNVSGTMVSCADDTSTFSLQNVRINLGDDASFPNGEHHIFGDCVITGENTQLSYDSAETLSIHKNSMLLIGQDTTFRYNNVDPNGLVMEDPTARLGFEGGTLLGMQNLNLTRGTVVFQDEVTFSVAPGRVLTFGGGVNLDDNLGLDFHLKSQWHMLGTLVDLNLPFPPAP